MKPIAPTNLVYYLVIAVVLLVGGILSFKSATHFASVVGRDRERIIGDLERIRPGFSVAQADSIRSLMRERDPLLAQETFADALMRDLGIALLVAVILTVAIEYYARSRLQEEIRSGVVEAAFRRLISPLVFNQIKGYVIGAKILKRNWMLEMVLREYPDKAAGDRLYLSRTVLSYDAVSLTGGVVTELLTTGLDRHLTGKDDRGTLPRFLRVQIGSENYTDESLKQFLEDDGKTFKKEFLVPTTGVKVVVELLELFRVPDTFVWNTNLQCEGARIVIDNAAKSGVAFEVMALTPERNQLVETVPGRTWEYAGGLLPWQGFQIRSFYPTEQLELPVQPSEKHEGDEANRAPQP